MGMKKRILFVEDTSDLAEVFADYFRAKGFDVFWSLNGEDGLKKIKQIIIENVHT